MPAVQKQKIKLNQTTDTISEASLHLLSFQDFLLLNLDSISKQVVS